MLVAQLEGPFTAGISVNKSEPESIPSFSPPYLVHNNSPVDDLPDSAIKTSGWIRRVLQEHFSDIRLRPEYDPDRIRTV